MNKIIDSATDPLDGERWWLESDDPWQTLSACMEIKKAMETSTCPGRHAGELVGGSPEWESAPMRPRAFRRCTWCGQSMISRTSTPRALQNLNTITC